MKHYALYLAVGLIGSSLFAQEQSYTQLGTTATTSTAQNLTGTTGTAQLSADAARTTAAELIQRNFSQENFEKRWATEEKIYKDAGISEEKIARLKDVNQKIWEARSKGESVDFQDLARQRREILSQEEIDKLRSSRREMIQQRTGERQTTGSAQQ